ncbi:nuclease domain-containing protein [Iodobacter arcticus]|uniref:Nuclease domain-containing protein n=1 Tax=Iodobacter arcticus TaxID=590593 RepID=A0ABW2QYI4_9NEIS
MELILLIKNGERKGLTLSLLTLPNQGPTIQWLKEDEVIEFQLTAPPKFTSATIELYEHKIEFSQRNTNVVNDNVQFIWQPSSSTYNAREACLFINFFGIAELNISLVTDNLAPVIEYFEPIEILASKTNATRVGKMFDFLAKVPGEALHSVFRTTRHSLGFEDGTRSPDFTLEKLEHVRDVLQHTLPSILYRPITRLIPEQRIIPTTGREDLDDSSIGWLLENASLLSETDNLYDAHFKFNSNFYRASAVQLAILKENTDLYENQVIHGFVTSLLIEAQNLFSQYSFDKKNSRASQSNMPLGYISFFEKISKFKKLLIGNQKSRCEKLIDSLKRIKLQLDSKLTVRLHISDSPIITPKVQVNHDYRLLFIEILKWHEKGKPDWSAYDNLFAIQSIPKLFEAYCYFRTAKILNNLFSPNDSDIIPTQFINKHGLEIWLRREPVYWMSGHLKSINESFVNSEGWTIEANKNIKTRGKVGAYANRSPDIVIEVFSQESENIMLILDAKYSTAKTSFITYLPQLTMKYVHGIHRSKNGAAIVKSLTILHPSEDETLRDFHCGPFDLFGKSPASPSLICLGVTIESSHQEDKLEKLIQQLFIANNIEVGCATETLTTQFQPFDEGLS